MKATLPKRHSLPKTISSHRISLRLLLVVPFVLQIFSVVGLVGYLSFRNGQKAVNDLANQLMGRVHDLVDQHLDSYMQTPPKLAQINGDAIELGMLDPHDMEAIGQFFWKQMQLYDVGYISYGSEVGEYSGSGFFIDPKQANVDEVSPRKHGNQTMYIYQTDDKGNRTKLATTIPEFETRKETWYLGAKKEGELTWNPIYQWGDGSGTIAIAVSRPVFDASQKMIGAVSVDQPLVQISNFLRNLKVSPSGKIMILERNGDLVANSSSGQPFKVVEKQPQRLQAIESPDPLIRDTAQKLLQRFGSFEQIQSRQQFSFQFDRTREFVQVTPWQDPLGLDWLVVVTVPESDFMAQIDANNRTTMLLCLAALMFATLFGLYTSRWITKPILRLSEASQAIALGKLGQTVDESQVHELGILAQSFNQMAQQLRDSFAALGKTNAELETRVQQRTAELTKALEDLQQTQAQLVQTEKMSSLGQMLAGIAHEINNPTSFIHGNLEYAIEYIQTVLETLNLYKQYYPEPVAAIQQYTENADLDFIVPDLLNLLDSMQEGTRRIQEIVLNLRNFSRLDEAKIKAVDLHEGIESTLLILNHRLKPKLGDIEITVIKHYGDLPLVECYAGQINQVFMNIIVNAIDAIEEAWAPPLYDAEDFDASIADQLMRPSRQGMPTLTITTQTWETDRVRIQITDNGIGITEAVQAKLFDPFFTTKPVGKGTGLGLSISYQIVVEHHKGRLISESVPNEGSVFTIELPVYYSSTLTSADRDVTDLDIH